MPRQIRHTEPTPATDDALETTLGDVRRANLRGCLYPHPRSTCKRTALQELQDAGRAVLIPRMTLSLGGWFAPYTDE